MASYQEKQELQTILYAVKGALAEASPDEQQAVAECRQLIAEMLDKYNDIAVVSLQMAWLELTIKEN